MVERTLIIIKHDGVTRGLVGEVVRRFENVGLKIVGMKMVWADENTANNHYVATDEWAMGVFNKAKNGFEDAGKSFPFLSHVEYGDYIQKMNRDYLMEGPVVAIVFEGHHSVELGRKIVGSTEPRTSLPGTIRGDLMLDSYEVANANKRSIRNLIHASGTPDEANREISLWFKNDELHSYLREHFEKHHF